ncbi:MAG: hypothetical protein ACYC26_10710 [Phycisphaerales bacterium]
MQRQVSGGIELACDFCGVTWDQVKPMIEGHRGSILCLACLAKAIEQAEESEEAFTCTMCRVEREAGMKRWHFEPRPAHANQEGVICWDCVQQADRAFGKDTDVDWTRKLPPTQRWG